MRIILLSSNPKDAAFFSGVATSCGFPLVKAQASTQVCDELLNAPSALVVVDGSTEKQYKDFETCLADRIGLFNQIVNPNWMFFVGEKELSKSPYLAQSELCGTIIPRTFTEKDQEQIAHLFKLVATSTGAANHSDIARFFRPNVKAQHIEITKSRQKPAIVEALKNNLVQIGFKLRTAAIIASAADELIMNAIFDAPVDGTGKYVYSQTPRSADFALDEKNRVDVSVAFDGYLLGISVTDRHGSLDKKKLLRHMSKSYESEEYKIRTNVAGAGVGLANVFRTCGGIVFECETGTKTTVSIFFKKTGSFKDFKEQFRFLSAITYFS